jgi:hypothetical protein
MIKMSADPDRERIDPTLGMARRPRQAPRRPAAPASTENGTPTLQRLLSRPDRRKAASTAPDLATALDLEGILDRTLLEHDGFS